jgi:alpha-N-arabinofuranosidase
MRAINYLRELTLGALVLFVAINAPGQANLPLYTNNLVNGFQDWSFYAIRSFNNTSTVHPGDNYSISVQFTNGYGALALQFPPGFNATLYSNLTFWINGGSSGGQKLQVGGTVVTNTVVAASPLPTLTANNWQQVTIPLSTLGVASTTNCSGIWIQSTLSSTQAVFYVDDIQFNAAPAPAIVNLGVDATQVVRLVDARQFGVNTATWDGNLDTAQTISLLQQAGVLALRFPGGSTADTYNWASNEGGNPLTTQATTYNQFANVAANIGAQVFITVNYGSGTSNEAAAWVLSANVTNNYGFKYWEVGNECYGSWEMDNNTTAPYKAHDPWTYAERFATYYQAMKAADPNIKVGAVVVPGEDNYINNKNHAATNLVTGIIHYGWTPVMLSTLRSLGVTPDFLIYHYYFASSSANSSSCADSDPLLMQTADPEASPTTYGGWAQAATSLQAMITDYIGLGGSNIELCVTENNADSGAEGRQSTSIVNALYLADSTCQLMQTPFNSYLWWDLHNGADTTGSFDPTLYGWRPNGDFGILNTSDSPYPTFYAEELLQYFARPGDAVLDATSDYLLLSAYAVYRTNGAVTMLVINKDTTTNFNAQIALTNFVPWTTATIQSYGIPQDQAAENNESLSLQGIATTNFPTAGTNFTYSFPALSLTLFTFAPAAPQLQSSLTSDGQFVLQVQGQVGVSDVGVPYVIQTSPDLINWTTVSTNLLAGGVLSITNMISPGTSQQFWRAVWQP